MQFQTTIMSNPRRIPKRNRGPNYLSLLGNPEKKIFENREPGENLMVKLQFSQSEILEKILENSKKS